MKQQGRNRFCRVALSPLTADKQVRMLRIDRSASPLFEKGGLGGVDRQLRVRTDLFQSFGVGAHLTFGFDDPEGC